jgi:hypothetical protein
MADDPTSESKSAGLGDLKGLLRQLVSPVIEQVETKVSSQIDAEVADRIDDLLNTRMATIDRAIGGLDRHLSELSARLDRIERSMGLSSAAELTETDTTGQTGPEPEASED